MFVKKFLIYKRRQILSKKVYDFMTEIVFLKFYITIHYDLDSHPVI
jgi:hypothetical protein